MKVISNCVMTQLEEDDVRILVDSRKDLFIIYGKTTDIYKNLESAIDCHKRLGMAIEFWKGY